MKYQPALRHDYVSPMPLLLLMCSELSTRPWLKEGLRNSGRINSRNKVGQRPRGYLRRWPFHHDRRFPLGPWLRQAWGLGRGLGSYVVPHGGPCGARSAPQRFLRHTITIV